MPGLLCAVSLDGPDNELESYARSALARFADEQRAYGGQLNDPEATLGAYGDASSGVASQRDGLSLAIYGVIVSGVPGDDDPYTIGSRLLAAYVEHGDSVFHDLNGRFLIAIWDSVAKRLVLVTDRIGLQRAYIWRDKSRIVVSTKMDTIVRHPDFNSQIRDVAVTEFIRCGYLLGRTTLMRDIDYLPYASVTTIDRERTDSQQYWEMSFRTDHHATTSEDDFAAEYLSKLNQAVERSVKPGDAILLSSGYDSRAIAMSAAQQVDPRTLRSLTLGPSDSIDVIYARRIAEELAIPHRTLPIPEDFFVRYGKRGVELAEGNVIGHTAWRCAGEDYLKSVAPRGIAHGLMGDFLQGNKLFDIIMDETDAAKGWEAYAASYPRPVLAEEEMGHLLKKDLYESTRTHVHDTLKEVYDAAPGEHPLHKVETLLVYYHDRRFYSMQSDYSDHIAPVYFPFSDNDLLQFMLDVPLQLRHNAKLYAKVLGQLNSTVAEIPMAATAMPVAASPLMNFFYRAKGRLDYSLLSKLPGRAKNRGAYVRYTEWLRGANRAYVERLLAETDYLEDYFNIDHVRKMTKEVLDGESDDYGKIYNLATFVLFRKRFCSSRTTS